ncbi:hypothetical protein QTP86_000053 [Hemibagrus guttatus]|nr:hypothetical protein QTP86_000053 [Hemibagrus guttatus]
MWSSAEQALREQLIFMSKEIEALRNDQSLMKQKQEDMTQAMQHCTEMQAHADMEVNITSVGNGSIFTLEENDDTNEGFDPCKRYKSLNQDWRATNYTTKNVYCDRSTQWNVKAYVHFFAAYPGPLSGKVDRIQYRKVYVNVGRAFNSRTGVFTAPVTGVYQFFFSTQTEKSGLKTELWLVVNGYWVAVSTTHVSISNTVGNLSTYMTTLRKGAQVYVTHIHGKSWANSASNTIIFGGSLLFVQS